MPDGHLEPGTISMMKIHQRHIERVIGKRRNVQELTQGDLQKYITKRSKAKTRKGANVTGTTIKKEIVTLNSAWKWAKGAGKLQGDLPKQNLRYPKSKERPVFQTWAEIERQIDAGASTELWDALYLDMDQIKELLSFVKQYAEHPFLYPMFAFAAYTGARRSELMRSELADIDLDGGVATIREKKRVKKTYTTRRVPISKPLDKILRKWIKEHPGSPFTFCHPDPILYSHRKERDEENPLTPDQASHHFENTLKDSQWEVIKGWHCLRHSFISNCASKGIDQRMIDEWVGHTTESMRRRYRHLFPSSQKDAMKQLFT